MKDSFQLVTSILIARPLTVQFDVRLTREPCAARFHAKHAKHEMCLYQDKNGNGKSLQSEQLCLGDPLYHPPSSPVEILVTLSFI